jgi:hypothetical protein
MEGTEAMSWSIGDGGAFGVAGSGGGIGATRTVAVDVYTAAFRVSGSIETPFSRVTEILNQLSGGHVTLTDAIVREHGATAGTLAAPSALVAVDEILVMVAAELAGGGGEMRIEKRPVKAQLAIPPLRVTGMIHVPMGSRPVDGLLHGTDLFMAMTDATIASASHPELERTVPVLAVRRGRAHVLLVAGDEDPEELLAEVLDEDTAEAWLRPEAEEAG